MIGGIAVIGITFFSPELKAMGAKVDFEKILPAVVSQYLPIGAKGVILAALLAAFMSTFVSTVNSGVAYIVNDIHKRYIKSDGAPKYYVRLGIHLVGGGHPGRDRLWLLHNQCAFRYALAGFGAGAGLCHSQRAEMALVAVQRPRFLGRDGRWHRRRADPAGCRAAVA